MVTREQLVKRYFQLCIGRYTSPIEHFKYVYPHFNAIYRLFTAKIFVSTQIGAFQAA